MYNNNIVFCHYPKPQEEQKSEMQETIELRHITKGVANGKIRDSPRRRDPCLKIRDRDLKALTKSEPETSFCENLSRFPKLFAAKHDNELHDIQ